MKKHNKYALIGLKALQRAADGVFKHAQKNGYEIPFWKNGRIEYEIPKTNTEQTVQPDHEKQPFLSK